MKDDKRLYLAIDQGTQSTRCIVFDSSGKRVARHSIAVSLQRLDDDRIEQDAKEILESVTLSIAEAVRQTEISMPGSQIEAAGIATQRSSVVAWDRDSGRPLSPVISWQDTRGHMFIDALSQQLLADIHLRTGLPASAHYGATKLNWLLKQPHLKTRVNDNSLCAGPLASFLIFNLTKKDGVARVDHANGSRMQLMNVFAREWDPVLLDCFEIPVGILPRLSPTTFDYGKISGLEIPMMVSQGDQTAAVFGCGELATDVGHVNLGSGGFVLTIAPKQKMPSDTRLLHSLAKSNATAAEYFLEGTINGAGSAVQWAIEKLGLVSAENHFEDWLANINDCPLFMNCVGGLGSPIWNPAPSIVWANRWVNLSGEVVSVDSDIAIVSVLESVLFLVNLNLESMRRVGCRIKRLRLTGGLSQSNLLCQRLADLSGLEVHRSDVVESTARGVAWLIADVHHRAQFDVGEPEIFVPSNNRPLLNRFHAFVPLITRTH